MKPVVRSLFQTLPVRLPLTAIFCVLVLIAAGYLLLSREAPPKPGLVKIDSYQYVGPEGISCMAVMPECGECYGEVIEKECWVNPDELTEDEKSVMRL